MKRRGATMTPVPPGATANLPARQAADASLADLLADITVPLLRASTASHQAVVETVLTRLVGYCGADRACVYRARPEATDLTVTHSCAVDGVSRVALGESAAAG